ncbi:hypothetical protein N7495_001717 [Penicillium taxi]|uniref:uncharacterized protein n=1 Tax=Penicillium taxi TaxID=168475 RepID=UPI00254534FC|nr:uncharacterized protein N7495_001717 [Penicillium taxi]KAJ5909035.1 hypothetical protein N7495_001717 [Penicillium taxi]
MKYLKAAVSEIHTSLAAGTWRNQWLIVHRLPARIIKCLEEEENCLGGIPFRVQWEDKTVSSKSLINLMNIITRATSAAIQHSMGGFYQQPGNWLGAARYYAAGQTAGGKEADDIFVPLTRITPIMSAASAGWPTFVMEVGYSEGLSQLRADGQKLFRDSLGEVRLVLLILIKPNLRRLEFEYISALKATKQRPPMGQQLANQQSFCMQNVEVDTAQNGINCVQGGPLRLDCQALLDDLNPPTPN